nr:ABC transporter ATP-binding protein [Corynebacterium mendelii]
MATPVQAGLAGLATVVTTVLTTLIPLVTRDAVNLAVGQADSSPATRVFFWMDPLPAVVTCLITVAVCRFGFSFLRRYMAGRLSLDAQHRLRLSLLASLQRLDGPGMDTLRAGQVVSRSISDVTTVQGLIAILPLTTENLLTLLVTVAVMFYLSPPLALVAVAFLPLVVIAAGARGRSLFAANWSAQQKGADVATRVEETVTGVRVVKAFAQERTEVARVEQLARELFAEKMRAATITARIQPLVTHIPDVAQVANVAVGGYLALSGSITIGTFVAFTAYLSTLTLVTRMVAATMVRIQSGLSSVSRVSEVTALTPSLPQPEHPADIPAGPLGLEINNVTFTDRGHRIVDGLDFSAEAQTTTVLVGPTGAGKTMLCALAARFYDPDSGSLALRGTHSRVGYRQLGCDKVRQAVCVCPDEAFIYSASVRDNIDMGRGLEEDTIRWAAHIACADEFIAGLDGGLDATVGEKGLSLSGGQRQRLALARAIAGKPAVLVLDDATSAIDAVTEKTIHTRITTELAHTTIIAVAHRHSTVELADTIVLVDAGHVVATGSLDEMAGVEAFTTLMDDDFGRGHHTGVPAAVPPAAPAGGHDIAALFPPVAHTDPAARFSAGARRAAVTRTGGMGAHKPPGSSAVPATRELLQRVARLPAATETPGIDVTDDIRDRGVFSFPRLVWSVRGLLALALLLLVAGVAGDLAFPWLVGHAIDEGVVAGHPRAIMVAAAAGAVVVVIATVIDMLRQIVISRAGERVLYRLRVRCFAHLQNLDLPFYETTRAGAIMTRMTTDIDALNSFISTGLVQTVVAVATVGGVAVMMGTTSAALTGVAFAAIPVVVAASWVFTRISRRTYTAARGAITAVNSTFQESVAALRTTQMHGMQQQVAADFAAEADRYRRLRITGQAAVALYFPGIIAIGEITQAIVVGLGAGLVTDGRISAGVLVAFLLLMGKLFGPVRQLAQIYDSYRQAAVGIGRIGDLLATTPAVACLGGHTTPDTTDPDGAARRTQALAAGEIVFDDVVFSYPTAPTAPAAESQRPARGTTPPGRSGTPVLKHINLSVPSGQSVALVGATGSGKSTIVKLLGSYYRPDSGAIRAGGCDIATLDSADWRAAVGTVPQEAHLFAGTIASNIAYGKPGATKQEIIAAAARVGALDVIAAIPGCFNAEVGEGGKGLASGQRQLVALARAELIEPKLMIYDEATATLDPATEKIMLAASARITEGRTSFIVAHRLATAARAGRILVIDDGRIIEDGTHDSLVNAGGAYARLVNAHTTDPRVER